MRASFYLFLLLVTIQINVLAQITITNNHMPSSGDTIRYSLVNPTAQIDYTMAGANKTWDFSNVTAISQRLDEYKSATKVNLSYFLFFGLSAYGLKIFDTVNLSAINLTNGYDFYKNSTSSFKAIGRGMEYSGIPSPSFFTDDDEIYQFPLDYNDYDSSTFRVNTGVASVFSFIQKGSRVNDVEGWGIVKTPFGTFDCLKVKSTIQELDSIVISSIPLPSIPRVTIEYKWLAVEEKIPVFEVIGTELAGQFAITTIRYRDKFIKTGIEDFEQRSNVLVKQLHSSSYQVEWVGTDSNEQLKLINLNGQIVDANITGVNGSYQIDMSNLPSGSYFLWIDATNFSEVVRLNRP